MEAVARKYIFMARILDQPSKHRYHIPRFMFGRLEKKHGPSLEHYIRFWSRACPALNEEWLAARADVLFLRQVYTTDRTLLHVARHKIYLRKTPIDFLLGWTPFAGLKIAVRPRVLIPRPETEHWLSELLEKLDRSQCLRILEVGTGSGCIAVWLLKVLPHCHVVSIDISANALKLARKNICASLDARSQDRATLVRGSVFDRSLFSAFGKFDLVISNPPYISRSNWSSLVSPKVRKWESFEALTGEIDLKPFSFHERLIDIAYENGSGHRPCLAMELDGTQTQASHVIKYARRRGSLNGKLLADTSNKPRAIILF